MTEKYIAGLIEPKILEAAESDSLHPVRLDLDACGAVEIRYDLFDESEWGLLSERVRKVIPNKLQIGTIRLKRDGGKFPDSRAHDRLPLWERILDARSIPDWLDLEQDCLYAYKDLSQQSSQRGVKILLSQHNFLRIPCMAELSDFANDAKRLHIEGLKIAAMSNSTDDCDRLYEFTKKESRNFKLFSAFGMGCTGMASRIWSLKEGANLTYCSIGGALAPGQLDVNTVKKALDNWNLLDSLEKARLFADKNGIF